MKKATNRTAIRVQEFLGPDFTVLEFEDRTATAEDAAAAIGCDVAQIAKSLVFQGKSSGEAVLAVASGPNRVDEKKLGALLGEKVRRPDADFVRDVTGYSIGGVSPVAHKNPVRIFLDVDLANHGEIWAAAGTPNAVFGLTPEDLVRLTGAAFVDIAKR